MGKRRKVLYVPRITIERIGEIVAAYFNISVEKLFSTRRVRKFAHPRMITMWLARRMTPFSYPQLGEKFNRDHSTVIHAVQFVGSNVKMHEDLRKLRLIIEREPAKMKVRI